MRSLKLAGFITVQGWGFVLDLVRKELRALLAQRAGYEEVRQAAKVTPQLLGGRVRRKDADSTPL